MELLVEKQYNEIYKYKKRPNGAKGFPKIHLFFLFVSIIILMSEDTTINRGNTQINKGD